MNLNNIHSVYFLGIGGIGMSALARWFIARGHFVAGYDRTRTGLTQELEAEGMHIHYTDSPDLIPEPCRSVEHCLLVYTPAIPSTHLEMAWFKAQGFELNKRSVVLGMITAGEFTVGIAGTHGKTTTSTMTAFLLNALMPGGCSAFLGGISVNFNSNLLIGPPRTPAVVEADEFDRSFLTLLPNIAVITSMDADHLDIYGKHEALIHSFNDYVARIKPGGILILRYGLQSFIQSVNAADIKIYTYGTEDEADFKTENLRPAGNCFEFDVYAAPHDMRIENIRLQMPGEHNALNMTAAIACTLFAAEQVLPAALAAAASAFKGVRRRFEYRVNNPKHIYIDDYAHHPSEISACLGAVRRLYPDKKLTVVFQPHLYTRTRDFAEGFSQSLSMADELLLLDIYPARELPIPGVSSDMLLADITAPVVLRPAMSEVVDYIKNTVPELLVTIGAGDIDTLAEPLQQVLIRAQNVYAQSNADSQKEIK